MPRTVVLVAFLVLVVGCSGSHDRSVIPSSTTPSTATTTTRSGCVTPSRFGVGGAANEIHGASRNGHLWGLALGPGHVPPRVGEELKIVWRMTGRGALRIAFMGPDGTQHPLAFGPERHSSSNYHRPGDEWGTGFRFATRGCWHIHFARDDTTADVWLDV